MQTTNFKGVCGIAKAEANKSKDETTGRATRFFLSKKEAAFLKNKITTTS